MTTPAQYQLGRRPPKNADALRLSRFLTGVVPPHPTSVDNLGLVTDFELYGNDRYGVCGPTSVANQRKQITRYLTGHETSPTQDDVFTLYKQSGNPNFDPNDPGGPGDQGVDMQTMLEAVHKTGIGNVQCVGFAKVDHTNTDEVRAAIAIFGSVLFGVDLEVAQQSQTGDHLWDYQPSSEWGGHAVLAGSYTSQQSGPDVKVITWAETVACTDAFLAHQLEEAWVVIWPEHLGTTEFQQGVDMATLASDYQALTGRPFPNPNPNPPQPAPTPVDMADRAFAAVLRAWVIQRHTGTNRQVAQAAGRWLAAKHLTSVAGPGRYATRAELAGILAEDDLDRDTVTHVLTRLADLGVPVSGLVHVNEEYA